MSRRPFLRVASHAAETIASLGLDSEILAPDEAIFRRDCLEVSVGRLTVYICHFKAPYPDPEAASAVRRLEAQAVRRLIDRRFEAPAAALWLVMGDLNEPSRTGIESQALAPLLGGGFANDLLLRLPAEERWSYHLPDSRIYSRPDALLASPALAAGWPESRPKILRAGLERDAERYAGRRLPGVGRHRPHASDHAALAIGFPGL